MSLWLLKMASVNEAKRSFWALVSHWKAKKSATLTLKSVNGDLRVSFNVNLGQHDDNESEHQKTHRPLKRGASSSKQRRKQRRAADPAVQLRAQAHAAGCSAAEAVSEQETDVETLRDEKQFITKSPIESSPEKEVVREELGDEPVGDGFCGFVEIPHDFGTPDYDHDLEKVKEAEKIMSQTDRCCFCTFQCPLPNQQESGKRLFGILETLWDHIENKHPLGFEWLG